IDLKLPCPFTLDQVPLPTSLPLRPHGIRFPCGPAMAERSVKVINSRLAPHRPKPVRPGEPSLFLIQRTTPMRAYHRWLLFFLPGALSFSSRNEIQTSTFIAPWLYRKR